MTRKELYDMLRCAAEEVYDLREAVSVASYMAEALAGVTRTDLVVSPDAEAELPEGFDMILAQLRAGRPVQYITGSCEFCGRVFKVREGVLIPRPETEELVAWVAEDAVQAVGKTLQGSGVPSSALAGPSVSAGGALVAVPSVPDENASLSILDIGTGSGAIAVSLAGLLPDATVRAVDVSDAALAVARENAAANGVRVELLKADILAGPDEWEGLWRDAMFDVVVSNPPYVPASDMASMDRNVRDFEPHTALFVPDDDPLLFYRAIARHANRMLADGGRLYFEIYEGFACGMRDLLVSEGFADVVVRRDINGKDRMLRCVKR